MTQERIEIVFNMDTTGSMYPVLDIVRRNLETTVGTLFKEIPNLKVGLGANGDYGDLAANGYTATQVDLTSDLYVLTQFIRGVGKTYGFGNGGEAYEVVLNESQSKFNWSVNSRKILVMIGDEIAHTPSWHENKNRLDWRQEAKKLADMGVQIHTIQCLSRRGAYSYYEELARIGNGYHLELDQFTDILSLMTAIIYRQVSEEKVREYEQVVVNRGQMNRTLDQSFATLTGRPRDAKGRFVKIDTSVSSDLLPVPAGRFQIMQVDRECEIRDFVQDRNLSFKVGKGFYLLEKSETVQPYKEIVLKEKNSGDMYTGKKAREMMGLPLDTTKNISPRTMKLDSSKYDVFIQSTSYTRKLKKGANFLYEVDLAS